MPNDVVYSSHLIEHVHDPVRLLDEMVRVSSYRLELFCPHWLGDKMSGKNPYHLSLFRVSWFEAYAKNRGLFCRCRISRYLDTNRGMVLIRFLLIPLEIHAIFTKQIENS